MKNQLTRAEISAIPAPKPTKTWNPVSHGALVSCLTNVVERAGIGVVSEHYSTKGQLGENMFGNWVLDIGDNDAKIQLGFRNSVRKEFAVGICSGTFVLVCSNMAFSGEFIEFRRHTGRLCLEELEAIGEKALEQVIKQGLKAIDWQKALRKHPLNTSSFKCITYDLMVGGVIPPSTLPKFLEAHEEEVALTHEKTLHEVHGAATRMIRGSNLFIVDERTRLLSATINTYRRQKLLKAA